MQADWQQFLAAQGAVIEDGSVSHFGDPHAELAATAAQNSLCDLGQFSILRVSGEDAQSFLQNLLSNDIKEVSASRAQHSSFNTAKGRMLANFLIWMDGGDYLMMLPCTLASMLQKKLSMYVLRAKVEIALDERIALGISGPTIRPPADSSDLPLLGVTITESAGVIRLGETRYLLCAPIENAKTLWQTLATDAKPVGSACWDWLNIVAGIPVILEKTQEEFVPQMVNFDLIGGINFKKGCYPGQEIVARMHYLGKLKRRMYLAHVKGAAKPGDALYSEDMAGQSSGMIANAAPSPSGGCDVLAVVQIASHDAHPIRLGSIEGEALHFEPLPYALPSS
jgi:tRNA-modifying protein YgfZ